jgi:signal transduction histidine kinase
MIIGLKNLNFKYRQLIHFSLITAIVLFQFLILIIFYNEIFNESKLDSIADEIQENQKIILVVNKAKQNYATAQENFQQFLLTQDTPYLSKFSSNVNQLSENLDTLSIYSVKNKNWKEYQLENNPRTTNEQLALKFKLDSILKKQLPSNVKFSLDEFKLIPFNYKDVLNSIHVESSKEVDTVKKKSLFGRLGNALAGKIDVQKEKVNVLVSMKFGKNVSTGDVASQLSAAFKNTNKYYAAEFAKIRGTLLSYKEKEAIFATLNLKLLQYSATLLKNYEQSLLDFSKATSERFNQQYKINKNIRNYAIIGLVFLVIIISIVLIYLTKLTFDYENRLVVAKLKIQQSLSFKNRIIGMISHEIRAPLSIISIYSKYLSSKIKDDEIKNVFDSVQFTTNSLTMLSNQILEYSKNENKPLALNPAPVNLEDQLSNVVKSLQTLVAEKGNKLEYIQNLEKNIIVNADTTKLHQLLYNIIGNANKFTNQGTITINCSTEPLKNNYINVLVSVKDSGKGISKEELPHIFDPYYQSELGGGINKLGVGLGLNLCKELVELFNGKIDLTSEENQGTTVSFNLLLQKINIP